MILRLLISPPFHYFSRYANIMLFRRRAPHTFFVYFHTSSLPYADIVYAADFHYPYAIIVSHTPSPALAASYGRLPSADDQSSFVAASIGEYRLLF